MYFVGVNQTSLYVERQFMAAESRIGLPVSCVTI